MYHETLLCLIIYIYNCIDVIIKMKACFLAAYCIMTLHGSMHVQGLSLLRCCNSAVSLTHKHTNMGKFILT